MNDDIAQFLSYVTQFCKNNPEAAPHVASAAQHGLEGALKEAYERAADMEVALVAAVSKRMKDSEGLIKSKLKKWEGRTSCRWDWYTGTSDKQQSSEEASHAERR